MNGVHAHSPIDSGDRSSISSPRTTPTPKYKRTFKASWIKSTCPVPVDMGRLMPSATLEASLAGTEATLTLSDSQASTIGGTNPNAVATGDSKAGVPDRFSTQQHSASPTSSTVPKANQGTGNEDGGRVQPVHSTPQTARVQQLASSGTETLSDSISASEARKSSSKKLKMQKLKKLFVTNTSNGSQPGSPGPTPVAPRTATSRHIWPFTKLKAAEEPSATPALVMSASVVSTGPAVPPAAPMKPVRREHRDMASCIPQRVKNDVYSMSIYSASVSASPAGSPSPPTRGPLGPSPVLSVWRGSRRGTGPSPQSTMSYDSGDVLARPPSFVATYSPVNNYLGHRR